MRERSHYLSTIEWFNLSWNIQPICKVFAYEVYLVGSCLKSREFRDVDIRVICADYGDYLHSEFARKVFGMFASEWLSQRTGLIIDLQLQTVEEASKFDGDRIALGTSV